MRRAPHRDTAPMSETTTPPPVPGDDKDWTWVLQRPCPDCGFDGSTVRPEQVAGLLRANAERWSARLATGDPDELRRRPQPTVWSVLEYACHVRDVYRLFAWRLHLMLHEDGPVFANWDQDATAVAERYDLADPAAVCTELTEAAAVLADRFAAVRSEQWSRPGTRSDGARFTVETFGRYLLHDPVHHLWDVGIDPSPEAR